MHQTHKSHGWSLRRDRGHQPPPSGKSNNLADTPIVLKLDGVHRFKAPELANMFGFSDYEEIGPVCPDTTSWRDGPEAFRVTPAQWRSRIIIVSRPYSPDEAENLKWEQFKQQLISLTGREPLSRYNHLIFPLLPWHTS